LSLTTKEIKEILAAIEASGWDEAQVTIGDVTISVSRDGAAGLMPPAAPWAVPAATPPAPALPEPLPFTGGVAVRWPVLGLLWRARAPGAAPFVDEGSVVAAGDTLCIVEVMKLMNHVTCEISGTVATVHATNGDMVERGAVLFTIVPAEAG
jgi:biotin carboxyl carrier protein